MDNGLIKPDPEEFFAGRKTDEMLNFYGVVRDSDAAAVQGAAVIISASFTDGTERLLGSAFTNGEGMYLISMPRLPDYHDVLGFKVRAGKAYIQPEGVDSPGALGERPGEEWGPEKEQVVIQEDVSGQEETMPDIGQDAEYPNGREETRLTVSLNQTEYNFIPVVVTPTVQTGAATNVGTDNATLHGSISDTGGENCDQRKLQIRAQGSEGWSDAGTETGLFGPESFSFTVTGLTPGVTYEFRMMAHNLAGWGEGNITTFTAANIPEALPYEQTDGSRSGPQDAGPEKSLYNMYRSTYWRWQHRYKE